MTYTKPTTDLKFKTVINKNTFYFFNPAFEEKYEGYLNSLKEILLILENENGLRALLALTGFSNETLKRLTTIIRVVNDPELSKLVYKDKWFQDEDINNIKEW